MTTYLVTCQCGNKLPVEVGLAGGQVVCNCGATVNVPTLRQLRELPTSQPVATTSTEKTRAAWDTRKGIVAAALIAASILAAIAGWSRYREPVVPALSAPAEHVKDFAAWLDTRKPADVWNDWISEYRTLGEQGFREFRDPRAAAIESYIADKRFLQTVFLALAAAAVALAIIAAVWPRPTTNPRQ
jgi:hypothetical protein